jgi:hypothetical protein
VWAPRAGHTGYLVTLHGTTAVHLGDTSGDPKAWPDLGLPEEGVDIPLVPYWYAWSWPSPQLAAEQLATGPFSEIRQPPRPAPRLELGVAPAERVERGHHAKPGQVDYRQPEPVCLRQLKVNGAHG